MATNKRTIHLGLDYSEFTGGVTEINRKMGLLDAEFKRASQEARNYGNETDQLGLKEDYLTQKIALQNQKVEAAKQAYEAAANSQEASAKEIDELNKRLLQEQTKLEQLNGELIETQRQTSGLDEANKKLNDSMKSLAIGAAAAVTALAKFAVDAANTADDLKTLSSQTGMTTTEIQRLQYASEFVDVSFETMSSSITKLTSKMDKARDGSKETEEAFRKLGVRTKDSNGQLRDATQVFYETIDALGKIKNETERDAMAMDLFGKSAKELNPLIEAGSKALKELGDEAEKTGKIMSESDVEAGAEMADSLARLEASITAVKNGLGKALMPILQDFADLISSIDPKVLEVVVIAGSAVALVLKLATAIGVLSTAMAAHSGVQMIFNATSLKSILIITALVAALLLLALAIKSITGGTEQMKKDIADVTKQSAEVSKNLQSSADSANTVGRNASGTDYWKGGRTWVGEEGPEIVDLPKGSKVIPNDKAAQLGGTTNNYYITIDAKNVQDFNHVVELAKQMPMAARRV